MVKVVTEFAHWDRSPEAAVKLAHRALGRLEEHPKVVVLLASQEYDLPAMLPALRMLLGDVPIWGSTLRQIWHPEGRPSRSLQVILLSGEEIQADTRWFTTWEQAEEHDLTRWEDSTLWVLLDALTPPAPQWLDWLRGHPGAIYGAVTGNAAYGHPARLCAGHRGGSGGMALLALRGLQASAAWATGWAPSGLLVEVTQSHGPRVVQFNGQPAAAQLSAWMGAPEEHWRRPPLRELVRLYPLTVETPEGMAWYAPLAVEQDGSLRLTLPLAPGTTAHLMVGSPQECLAAAQQAARQALEGLASQRPRLALLLVDWAWAHLFWARPQAVHQAVRQVLGAEVPIVGGYTYGPLVRPGSPPTPVQVLDNHLLLVLFE